MSVPTSEQLFESHLDLALKIARSISIIGHTVDEQEQEARIALWKAANAFDSNKGGFEPFASTVIRNHLRNTLDKATRRARVETISLDSPAVNQEDVTGESLKETVIPAPDDSPLLEAERSDIRAVLRDGMASLTLTQQEVLQSYAEGSSYAEIARQKRVSKASVRQMVQRAAKQARPEIQKKGVLNVQFMPASYEKAPVSTFDSSQHPPPRSENRVIILIILVFLSLWLLAMLITVIKEIFFS